MSQTVTFVITGNAAQLQAVLANVQTSLKQTGATAQTAGNQSASGLNRAATAGNAANSSFVRLAQSSQRMGQAGLTAGNNIAAGASRANSSVERLYNTISHVRAALAAVAGVSLGIAALRSIGSLIDGYTNITSKLRNVTKSEEDLIRVRERTFEIAQRTRTQYEDTVTLYARMTRALATMNTTEQQRLQITETINKAYTVSGATLQESSNSIIQLTQALASGVLRGEEFNSVAEQGPIILDMLQASLGKTRGELRAMAKEGKLTSEVVTKAILDNQGMIAVQFANMTVTIEGSWVRVTNAWQRFVGQSAQASGVANAITTAFSAVANNMNEIGNAVLNLGATIALVFAGKAIAAVNTYSATLYQSVTATLQSAAASKAQAQADVGAAVARSQLVTSNIQLIAQEKGLAAARAQAAQMLINQARADQAAAAARGASLRQVLAYNATIISNQAILATQTRQLAALTLQEAAARNSLVAAANAQVAAQTRLAATAGPVRTVLNGIMSVGSSLFSAMGGWTTVVIALTYAFYSWVTSVNDTSKVMDALKMRTEELETGNISLMDSIRGVMRGEEARKQTLEEVAQSAVRASQAEISELQKKQAAYSENVTKITGNVSLGALAWLAYATKVEYADRKVEELQQSMAKLKLTEFTQELAQSVVTLQRMFGLIETGKDVKPVIDPKVLGNATKELEKHNIKLQEQKIQLTEGTQAAMLYAAAQDLGLKSVDQLPESVRKLVEQNAALSDGVDKLREAQNKANNEQDKAPKAMAKALEESQKAIDSYNNKYAEWVNKSTEGFNSLRDAVDPLAEAAQKFEEQKSIITEVSLLWQDQPDKMREVDRVLKLITAQYAKQKKAAEDAVNPSRKAIRELNISLQSQNDKLKGLTDAQIQYNESVEEANLLSQEAIGMGFDKIEIEKGLEEWLKKLSELRDKVDITEMFSEFDQDDTFDKLIKGIEKMEAALRSATDPEIISGLEAKLGNMRHALVTGIVNSSQQALQSMQSMTKEGSRAYGAMQIAIDALSVAQAISAVLNQAQGDPYTAFARMAAMAAAVAALGVSIGNFKNSGFSDTAAQRQATQGTGSVLGDATGKSESIANAVQITADATSTLVGLNRGMLDALRGLQSGLSAAGGLLARGAGDADFSALNLGDTSNSFLDSMRTLHNSAGLFDFLGIFKGKSKITDQGIVIFGGALNDLLENIAVGAYQEVQSRSWLFGSRRTRTGMVDVSNEFSEQFQLVINSIVDTVEQGALALGLLPSQIDAALAAFKVEEIRISLKDLTPEEQQAELEAVFSKLFDDIAGAVVPFVKQFQRVGEGLGETLVRIATEVQVAKEAFRQLGLAVSTSDPEKFAQVSDALIEAAGGIEDFMAGFQSFVNNFATDSHKFKMAESALATAFAEVGLTIPKTRDGMWELMQSLDATTEQGQKQIATLLRLSDTADKYYTALERNAEELLEKLEKLAEARQEYAEFISGIIQETAVLNGTAGSAFVQSLRQIGLTLNKNISSLNEMARAAGLSSARQQDLAAVQNLASAQVAKAIRELEAATKELADKLYGKDLVDKASSFAIATRAVSASFDDMIAAAQRFREALLIDDQLSPLNSQEQLTEALRQLRATGSEEVARRALEIGRDLMASGADYRQLFNLVTSLVRPQIDSNGDFGGGGGGSSTNDNALTPAERLNLAQQLAQNVADLAGATGRTFEDIATQMGFNLQDLFRDLGLKDTTIGSYLTSLQADSYSITDLASLITGQVDRIVNAIIGNYTMPISQTRLEYGGTTGRTRPDTILPPEINGQNAGTHVRGPFFVHDKSYQLPVNVGTGEQKDGVEALTGTLERLFTSLEKAVVKLEDSTVGSNNGVREAIRDVSVAARATTEEIRSLQNVTPTNRSERTPNVLNPRVPVR